MKNDVFTLSNHFIFSVLDAQRFLKQDQKVRHLRRRWGAWVGILIWALFVTAVMGWWRYLSPLLSDVCKGVL